MAKQFRPTDQYYHVGTFVVGTPRFPTNHSLFSRYSMEISTSSLAHNGTTREVSSSRQFCCLACQSFEESIDHVYSHCNKWKQYIALASALLHRLGGPAPSASLHPLEFLLQRVQFDSQRSCEYWYVLSIVVYWQKRSKLSEGYGAFAKILDARNNSSSSYTKNV